MTDMAEELDKHDERRRSRGRLAEGRSDQGGRGDDCAASIAAAGVVLHLMAGRKVIDEEGNCLPTEV
jgi:hypothetical protein